MAKFSVNEKCHECNGSGRVKACAYTLRDGTVEPAINVKCEFCSGKGVWQEWSNDPAPRLEDDVRELAYYAH